LLDQDLVYVGGGMTANMLVLWRFHGLDRVLREAWENGIVIAGPSAGAICWFEDGVTASVGDRIGPLGDGLAFLPGTFCPHYHDDDERTRVYRALVEQGFPPGIGAGNEVAVRFRNTDVAEVVTARREAGAWRVQAEGEAPLEARLLA
jgi:dipeptidase E